MKHRKLGIQNSLWQKKKTLVHVLPLLLIPRMLQNKLLRSCLLIKRQNSQPDSVSNSLLTNKHVLVIEDETHIAFETRIWYMIRTNT